MIKHVRNFFSDNLFPTFHKLGFRVQQIINRNNNCLTLKGDHKFSTEDHLLSNSFVHTPKLPSPKFDSIADRLMAEASVSINQASNDYQQLLLESNRNFITLREKNKLNNSEVFQQLCRLTELLQSIISEHSLTGSYNISFLREIIHNICLDLNVMMVTLDSKLMMETEDHC